MSNRHPHNQFDSSRARLAGIRSGQSRHLHPKPKPNPNGKQSGKQAWNQTADRPNGNGLTPAYTHEVDELKSQFRSLVSQLLSRPLSVSEACIVLRALKHVLGPKLSREVTWQSLAQTLAIRRPPMPAPPPTPRPPTHMAAAPSHPHAAAPTSTSPATAPLGQKPASVPQNPSPITRSALPGTFPPGLVYGEDGMLHQIPNGGGGIMG
jgi:hypothetical protein